MSQQPRPGHLVFADGSTFPGDLFGALDTTSSGEAVFTTGMTGYQEVLTDPSYAGQIVTMTAVQIGNTGINAFDAESRTGKPQVAGFVVRELSPSTSNWRAESDLESHLRTHNILGIAGVDTRAVTQHLREHGAQNAVIGSGPVDTLVDRARQAPSMEGLDLAASVTTAAPYIWSAGNQDAWFAHSNWPPLAGQAADSEAARTIVALDFGLKQGILRCLQQRLPNATIHILPANSTAADVLSHQPDGIFLSNGPGDPAAVDYAVRTVRELLGKKPIFGICLGHQLLALALGAKTYKLKFGHRGLNQPVQDLRTRRVEITTQNHGFAVAADSLQGLARSVALTHIHLNDGTAEGLEAPDANAFSVQYHPEASAGPHDSMYLFDRFADAMTAQASKR